MVSSIPHGTTAEFAQRQIHLLPFRQALNEIKRRLFFAAPGGRRLALSLLGYSLVNSNGFDYNQIDQTLNKINTLLSLKKSLSDGQMETDGDYNGYTLKDYELGCLIGHGCNAAVYEAKLRQKTTTQTRHLTTTDNSRSTTYNDPLTSYINYPSQRLNSLEESDIEILSRTSSNSSESFVNDQSIDENDESLKEVRYRVSRNIISHRDSFGSSILPGKYYFILAEVPDV
ncbi:unnamed protein product, partial [Didymodactylos carnosus]